ncbi:MAG: hypothetical protein ACI89L_001844, partial [Phycisphaerales bacterium]
ATALGDDSIPSSLPPFSGWATSEWSMSFTDGAFSYSVGGVLTDLTVVQERCVADINGDCILDNGDLDGFVQLFLTRDPTADLNGDGILDNGDIITFVSLFLAGC